MDVWIETWDFVYQLYRVHHTLCHISIENNLFCQMRIHYTYFSFLGLFLCYYFTNINKCTRFICVNIFNMWRARDTGWYTKFIISHSLHPFKLITFNLLNVSKCFNHLRNIVMTHSRRHTTDNRQPTFINFIITYCDYYFSTERSVFFLNVFVFHFIILPVFFLHNRTGPFFFYWNWI